MSQNFDFHHFLSGFMGGVAGLIVGHPFDTVKVRLQTQGTHGMESRYKGATQCFFSIARTEGLRGLYKGIGPPMLGFTVINSIVFGVHGSVLHYLQPNDDLTRPTLWKSCVAGGIAGAVQSFLAGPMELLRTRMMLQSIGEKSGLFYQRKPKQLYSNSFDCLVKTYRVDGIRGIFDGMLPTLLREIPAFATYFLTYDYVCQWMMRDDDKTKHSLSLYKLMFAGGMSGITCWVISYPFDVVKTRVQIDGMGQRAYSGMMDCIVQTYKAEGLRAFVKGLAPTLARAFPCNAATFAAHSLAIRHLKDL